MLLTGMPAAVYVQWISVLLAGDCTISRITGRGGNIPCHVCGVLFLSLVLYGLYPFVVEKLDAILSSGARFGLHVRADGAMRRLDCHVFDDVSVKTVLLAVIPGGNAPY